MIATGTDIKPLEVVMFMRTVRSRNYFEQMKGRGVRVINPTDFQAVTPDARDKTHFVLIDCVGVTEGPMTDGGAMDRKPSVSFEKLLQAVAIGQTDVDTVSSLAGRLARLDLLLGESQQQEIAEIAGGETVQQLVGRLVAALDPDHQIEVARQTAGLPEGVEPSAEQIEQAATELIAAAVQPLQSNPALRNKLVEAKQRAELTIDDASKDEVLEAGYSPEALERARQIAGSFEAFIQDNKDEISALQFFYSQPYDRRLRFSDIKALANAISAPPRSLTPEKLWQAYETLDRSKVRGSGQRILTDIVSLVRFALHQEPELVPFRERVDARFTAWLAQQEASGRTFTPEQRRWLELIRDHIAGNFDIESNDFESSPFKEHGGLGKVYQVFGGELDQLIDEMNRVLAA
jgi:type I restriction enzyme R subunit